MIICPECGTIKPVREDAEVCSSNCRVKQWRIKDMKKFNYKLKCENAIVNGTTMSVRASNRSEADAKIATCLDGSKLESGTYSFTFEA